jgi:hypothetical protein
MASMASSVGAPKAGTPVVPSNQGQGLTKSTKKFDVRVVPDIPCQLIFIVYQKAISPPNGRPSDADCVFVQHAESSLISKPTVFHMTLPNKTLSYEIIFKADQAFQDATDTQSSFDSVDYFVTKEMKPSMFWSSTPTVTYIRMNPMTGVPCFKNVPAVFNDEENISFVETDTVSATAGGDRKEPSDQKNNS